VPGRYKQSNAAPNESSVIKNIYSESLYLRTQFATSKRGGIRYAPMAFTEQGVAMLSSVLNSEKAIKINIEIMRAFARYRALLIENQDLRIEIRAMDEKINKVFKFLLDRIDALHQDKSAPRKMIGFKRHDSKKIKIALLITRTIKLIGFPLRGTTSRKAGSSGVFANCFSSIHSATQPPFIAGPLYVRF